MRPSAAERSTPRAWSAPATARCSPTSRALENAAFVVASATVQAPEATAGDVFPTYGHALAVDPWGRVLADLGEERRAWQVLELDLSEVEQIRTALPALRNTRPDVYAREPVIVQVT